MVLDEDPNKSITLKPADIKEPLGKYIEQWNGVNVDKNNKYELSVEFGPANDTAKVLYHRENTLLSTDSESLELNFKVDKIIKEGIKQSIYLVGGSGEYVKTKENKREQLDNQEMIAFVVHPNMVFGVDLPKVMLHDLRIQKRKLTRPWVKK